MDYQTIILDKDERVAIVTLNRPEKLNAWNQQMGEEFRDVIEKLNRDDDVGVVVVTGAGRAFCSGADVGGFAQGVEARVRGGRTRGENRPDEGVSWAMVKMDKPTIASINGPAVGLGCTLALACDIRIASETATIGAIFVRVGLTPEFGSTYLLTRVVGLAKACELVFTGKVIGAREAKEIGLVNQVVPAEELKATSYEMARTIADGPPIAIKLAKRGLYQGLETNLVAQLQYESLALDRVFQTEDHAEGVRAFLEKRKPVFKGR